MGLALAPEKEAMVVSVGEKRWQIHIHVHVLKRQFNM